MVIMQFALVEGGVSLYRFEADGCDAWNVYRYFTHVGLPRWGFYDNIMQASFEQYRNLAVSVWIQLPIALHQPQA
jgi:hypothetical protein